MARVLKVIARVLVVLVLGAMGYGVWKNPEKATLDAAARSGAPGSFVGLPDGITHYDLSGPDSGRVVVLVHGFSVPYYIWDSTVAGLTAAGHRVLRYDVFGRGLSDRPDAEYDGTLYDRQLDGLLDSLHVQGPIDLVGLSFGGYVTAHYVASHPARVHTLTLVDPVSESSSVPGMLKIPVLGPWIWQVTVMPGRADSQLGDFLHPEHYPTWPDQYRPQMRYKGFGRALLRSSMVEARTDWDSLYAAVGRTGIPVLLIWGKQDRTVDIKFSDLVRRNIPGTEFVPVDSSGHLPHIEQARLFDARLTAFLDAHRTPAP